MEKRFLLAIVLCLFILMFYQSYMAKQQEEWKALQEASQAELDSQEAPSSPFQAPVDTGAGREHPSAPPDILGSEADFPEPVSVLPCEEVIVDTPLYQATFCSHNGRLMSWRLKEYFASKDCNCPVIEMFSGGGASDSIAPAPHVCVERIHALRPDEYPLGLEVSTGGSRAAIREMLRPDHSNLVVAEGGSPGQLVFSGEDTRGRGIQRIYTFFADKYLVDLDIEITGIGPELMNAGLGLKLTERIKQGSAEDRYTFSGFMAFIDGSLVKKKKLKEPDDRYHSGNVVWQGFSDKYFLNCLLPRANPVSSIVVDRLDQDQGEDQGLWTSRLIYNIQSHLQGDLGLFSYTMYIGPKDLDVLQSSGHHLDRSIDLGWFEVIARPLLMVLKFFYRYTHNYGIAIIILTIIIKILFHPLTRKQYESMGQMQKLQPKMQEIREKFKNDREKMNKEVMDLYRTHKINPLGGCWPMLLQIPVFFALYKALLNSIELRHAPFMLWIQDLSAKDPCYVTPLVMGATMFLQQKMTPAAGDPAQQKMMMFMPVIFTFLFLNFPSGLVLYWLVNNVITIGQQYVSQKRKG